MYNTVKKMFFNNFRKGSYHLVSKVIGKEEIYWRNDKTVVVIEDEEVGKRIFSVAKSLKQWEETISSNHITFKLTDFVADKSDTVQILFANIDSTLEVGWDQLTELEKLRELVSFAYSMQEKGYIIDDSIFDNENCSSLSDFLSFFKVNGTEEPSTNGCLIKYVHYVLSHGGDMKEYYQPIIKENEIRKLNEFPYHMFVIQMCYHYCLNGAIPENIDLVLEVERLEKYNPGYYENKLVVSNPDLSTKFSVTEKTSSYTVYEDCIKIYKKISMKFRKFLEDERRFLRTNRQEVEEFFTNWVIDFNGNIIGYEYERQADENSVSVLDFSFDNQYDIFLFIDTIGTYLHNLRRKAYSDFEADEYEFDIETDLVCSPEKKFKIRKIESLFKLVSDNPKKIEENITMIFFKLLLAYLEKTYGKISDKQTLYEKKEVRYLSPILAKEFCHFALGRKVNLSIASEELDEFLQENIFSIPDETNTSDIIAIDKNLMYDESNSVPFLFKHEAENKYGVKMEKGIKKSLPDGRLLVTLNRRETIQTLKRRIESVEEELEARFRYGFTENVKFVEISEIIYSLDLSSNNSYYVAGYVTTTFKGEPLTTEKLLSFNNRDILKITGMLMSNFGSHYIHIPDILIDITHKKDPCEDEFVFYINKLDENFKILKSDVHSTREFVENFFTFLVNNGYNENAFVDFEFQECDYYGYKSHLMYLTQKMDAFCEEHQIYYDSSEKMCPVCLKTRQVIEEDFDKSLPKVFEDKYAIHYELSWQYNLKVYKEDSVDLTKVEANINTIIEKRLSKIFVQECFIPCKKALDSNQKFIGYLYPHIDFESQELKNLKDTERLENLPRIRSMVRLILQVAELMDDHLYFIQNPYGDVFLSKNHKKQVQIVNVEFLGISIKGKRKNTINWTCEYIRNVIRSDNCIDINMNTIDWKENDFNYMLNSLQKYAQTLTRYCPIHKFYYNEEYLFCPKCVNRTQLKKLNIEYIKSSDISDWKEFSSGGESVIYEYEGDCLAKIFKEEEIDYSFKTKVLSGILSKREILEEINRKNFKFKYIIPKKILVDKKSHKILGYVMDDKVIGKPLDVLCDKKEVASLGITRKDVFEILITVGEGIQTLHDEANIFVGDLNGRNILFDKDKNVYFLDFDGMGVDDISPRFWTEDYIDPVSKNNNNITKKDDWYSLAIQAFYYLTSVHPFKGVYQVDKRTLSVPERMESRISLLGNHGITIPAIAIPWDWMENDLKNAFLNIFEGDSRESIVPELKAQYQSMYGGESFSEVQKEEIIPIGSKFIAKRINPFSRNMVHIINPYSAICREENKYYTIISRHNAEYQVHFPESMKIIDILLLEDYDIAFAVYYGKIIGFDIREDKEIFFRYFQYWSDNVVVNQNTLYLSQESGIYQIEFNSSGKIKENRIKFLVEQKTVGFLVEFNSKFVLVKRNNEGEDSIYCNSEVLCEIDSNSNSKYNILYDDTTKTWLVINSNRKFITIHSSNGHFAQGIIPEYVKDMNVKNIAFNKGVIYIPSQNNLYIMDLTKQRKKTIKKMECDKIMTPDSHLCNFNSQGFSVITNNTFYEVAKK